MKILTIESNDSGNADPAEFKNWPIELRDAFEEADVVIFLFAPFAHTIMKGPEDLILTDVRSTFVGGGWEFYQAQRDVGSAQAEARRVRSQNRS